MHDSTSSDADALDLLGAALKLGVRPSRLEEVERHGVQIGCEAFELACLRRHRGRF